MIVVLTPYLAVADARAAIEWYAAAYGAVVSYDPIVMPDGRVGHVELALLGGRLMLADAYPELGVVAPTVGRASVTIHAEVTDCQESTDAARAAGATVEREPTESAGGLGAVVIDPFGHRWMLRQEG